MKKDKKEIERLKEALHDANIAINDLQTISSGLEFAAKQLRSDLRDKDEKYAALLERYISTMEKAANLHDPGVEVMNVLHEIENMLLAWYQAEGYDTWLGDTFEKIKKKYTEV